MVKKRTIKYMEVFYVKLCALCAFFMCLVVIFLTTKLAIVHIEQLIPEAAYTVK